MSLTELSDTFKNKTVLVVGCGGLGCFVVEALCRAGVGRLIIADGDVFCESNLNRQLYATAATLGRNKAEVAAERAAQLKSGTEVTAEKVFFSADTAEKLMSGVTVAVDCTDNSETRLLMEKTADKCGVPLVHGAISGMVGQLTTVFPGDWMLKELYSKGMADTAVTLCPVPQIIAGYQAAETLKLLAGESGLRGKLLLIDLEHNLTDVIPLKK